MPMTVYYAPTGKEESLSDVAALQSCFASPSASYWKQGSGDAAIKITDSGEVKELIIMPHERYGFYLQYTDGHGTWLSLRDRQMLNEVATCLNEWRVSIGLFLPAEAAWAAVVHFASTGQRSPQIEWIAPKDMPEDGNY
jgi:hypothetical protein